MRRLLTRWPTPRAPELGLDLPALIFLAAVPAYPFRAVILEVEEFRGRFAAADLAFDRWLDRPRLRAEDWSPSYH